MIGSHKLVKGCGDLAVARRLPLPKNGHQLAGGVDDRGGFHAPNVSHADSSLEVRFPPMAEVQNVRLAATYLARLPAYMA